jgi:G:T/U-mismatch repair DNA glycosylase
MDFELKKYKFEVGTHKEKSVIPQSKFFLVFLQKKLCKTLLGLFMLVIRNFFVSLPSKKTMHPETHPLVPFLPQTAKILLLGSFPPPPKRWSMNFFYPNLNNDMWRIMGIIFFNDKNYFLTDTGKAFCKDTVVEFVAEKGIALFDTASVVRRLNDNASDKFLEVVKQTNIKNLLAQIPYCTAIAATGQKASEIIAQQFEISEPKIGEKTEFCCQSRKIFFYRMPSTSRAYPLKLETKAEFYKKMLEEIF